MPKCHGYEYVIADCHMITRAYDHILVAETSWNFYWGSRWVHRSFDWPEKGVLERFQKHTRGHCTGQTHSLLPQRYPSGKQMLYHRLLQR
jgi:hypothetical protein